MRLFIAISFSEEIYTWLAAFQKRLKTGAIFTGAQATWVDPQNAHITLAFLGNQPADRLENVFEACEQAVKDFGSVRLAMERLVMFPNPQSPKVISLDVGGDLEHLMDLQQRLAGRLEDFGFEMGELEFKPHITLARLPSTRGLAGLRSLVTSHGKMVYRPFSCERIHVIQSILHSTGPEYVYLRQFQLTTAIPTNAEPSFLQDTDS